MQSKMIFVLLFILSFSAFHDSFISLLDKNKQTNIVHYMSDDVSSIECTDINEIHNMFHFIAIVSMYNNNHIQLPKREIIPHDLVQYTPPLEQTSYKPPIA